MFRIKRLESEGAPDLALRLGVPLCMLLRANGVVSSAWIETGDESAIPDGKTCVNSAFPCPAAFVKAEIPERIGYIIEDGDTVKTIAEKFHLPVRLVHSSVLPKGLKAGEGIVLPFREENMKIVTVSVHTAWRDFDDAPSVMLLNNHFSRLYPGMKLLVRG